MRVALVVIICCGGATDCDETAGVDRDLKYEFSNIRKKVDHMLSLCVFS